MAKIKLVVSATIEEAFSDFIISKKAKGLAEKTLQSYQRDLFPSVTSSQKREEIGLKHNLPAQVICAIVNTRKEAMNVKILFINLPYHGHLIPTIGLVQALIKAGHQVTYLTPHDWEERIADSDAEFLGYENNPKLDKQIRNAFFKAEEVIASHDLVLYEQFFFVGKHLAEKHGKKCVRIFTAPATNKELMRAFISSGGPMGIFRVPLVGTLWTQDCVKDLGIRLQCRNWLDEIVENPPDCNLVYTPRSFQPFSEDFPEAQFHFIGPSVYDRKEEEFPALSKPVIYISIGTILKGGENFFRACLEAFEKEKVTVILSVGNFDISRLKHIPENFVIRNRVPQIAVLKQADLFITHGGMNSVSEAMVHGVPMVVIPFVSDQPVNARQVEKMGLGKVLDYKGVTADTLRDAAFVVMEDRQIQENLRKIQEEIACAPGNAGMVGIIETYSQR